ncbi:MAG: U32 family peptidase [Eubacterium sp.]|nr:U32 family peptidase [Eubacterium sp.]
MKKPELLAPASGLDVLKTAIRYGADAVYIGGEQFGLRARAKNFSMEDMKEGISYAHSEGKKIYVTANITAHTDDLPGVRDYFEELKTIGPDALIISDPGVFMLARQICPEIDIHISTQANNVNTMTCRFWQEQGAKRVVTARELSLGEIGKICAETDGLEIETFVHGAMCISHSGRCLLSHYFTGRDANLGACTHPCRWKYYITEESRPGEYLPVEENERGTYIFNSKDLCMISHVPELIESGIDSFKIEGRMKTALYVASVVRAYRMAIDDYFTSREKYEAGLKLYEDEVTRCTYRQFTTGFFFGATDHDSQIYDANTYDKGAVYLGQIDKIDEDGMIWMEQKNKFSIGDTVHIMRPYTGTGGISEKGSGDGKVCRGAEDIFSIDLIAKVTGMSDDSGKSITDCPHPGQYFGIRLEGVDAGVRLEPGYVVRMDI